MAETEKEESKKVVVNFKMDEELKKEFLETCRELGMTLSSAINIFAKQMVREGKLPFTPTTSKGTDRTEEEVEVNLEASSNQKTFERFMQYMKLLINEEDKED